MRSNLFSETSRCGPLADTRRICSRVTGKPEVISLSTGLVPTNALVSTNGVVPLFVGQPEAGTPAGMSTRCGSCWISGIEREWQVFGGDIYPNRGRDTVYLNVTTDRLSCIALGMLSSQFRCNRAKAGGEDVVSDLRNHGVAFGPHYFEIGPPLRECAVALGNAM